MLVDILIVISCLLTIFFAILALETKNMYQSIIYLWLTSLAIGLLFFLNSAIFTSLLQWFLYSGVLIILFVSYTALIQRKPKKSAKATQTRSEGI